jgi:RNA polymerase sigma-70 factor (ECF subfamily)
MRHALDPALFAALLTEARAGSRSALGRLWMDCRGYLLMLANQKLAPDLQCKMSPSDVVQETFLEAQRDFPQFNGEREDELLAWLGRILAHNIANVSRSFRGTEMRSVEREVPLAGSGEGHGATGNVAQLGPTPGDEAEARDEVLALERALAQLPDHYRLVVRLRYEETMTFPQIGVILNCSAEAARAVWARAVDQLQRHLDASHAGQR